MKFRAAVLLLSLTATACHNSGYSAKSEIIVLSKPHNICLTAPNVVLESRERAVDYDYGVIASGDGVRVRYYVSSEPGRVGYGNIVSTRTLDQHTTRGKSISEEVFSDGNRSLLIDGFASGIDGKAKVHVKFYFSTANDDEFMLARELIDAVEHCAPG